MSWDEVTILVDRAKGGDRAAFGELVTRFQAAVQASALSHTRDAVEAQDLAQEVFVHAMRKLPQLRDPRCFGGWLRRITTRMAINRATRRGPVYGAAPESLAEIPGRSRNPDDRLVLREQATELRAGLRKLNPLDRATLEAFYFRGHSLRKMARDFEVPTGTIKRRLHVARKRLKDALVDDTTLAV